MRKSSVRASKAQELAYLENKPIVLKYQVVSGPPVEDIQLRDLVYDEYDLKIRKLDTTDNLIYLREVQK